MSSSVWVDGGCARSPGQQRARCQPRFHFWLAPPLQVHSWTRAPLAVACPLKSGHSRDWTPTMVPSLDSIHRWPDSIRGSSPTACRAVVSRGQVAAALPGQRVALPGPVRQIGRGVAGDRSRQDATEPDAHNSSQGRAAPPPMTWSFCRSLRWVHAAAAPGTNRSGGQLWRPAPIPPPRVPSASAPVRRCPCRNLKLALEANRFDAELRTVTGTLSSDEHRCLDLRSPVEVSGALSRERGA